jgi:sigma-B regulation protein RsbU (phosphoserine phosphatase)
VTGLPAFARSPAFAGVSEESWAAVGRAGRRSSLLPGDVLLRPGEASEALHFVLEGSVEVRLEGAASAVSRVQAGECVGELSVIDGQPASAWVVAAEPCLLLSVPAERVWSKLLPLPGFARGLLRLLGARMRHTLERQSAWDRLRGELRLAAQIQSSMLPASGVLFPERTEVDCAAVMDPAAEVGGDFFDAFFLDERRLFLAVGDVAGKGIAAAMFMARSLALLRSEALRRRQPEELLRRLNEALAEGNEQATFVSLFCGVYDTWTGVLRYANGGALAPFARTRAGWRRLPMPRGVVVGALPGVEFSSSRARLAAGDELVVYTDGVSEASDPAREMFGEGRLAALLAGSEPLSAPARLQQIRAAVRGFESGLPPSDDLTLFVLRRPF